MAMKTYRPITPTQRYKTTADFSVLTPRKELPKRPKKLRTSKNSKGGRNYDGHITVRHQGGGHRRHYRLIDFYRKKRDIPAKVLSIEYDPNRTAYIALVCYKDGEKNFILAPLGMKKGDTILASESADILPGNNLSLTNIPVGTVIHNIEMEPGRGGKIARSAGQFAQLMAKEGTYFQVKLPSGELRLIHRECRASIGQISNQEHENIVIGKAGRQRWLGIRPTTRGVAMNPIDHPMGGGEGKASGGHPKSPWGQKSKGYKTRRNKRTSQFIVKRRR